MDSPYWEDDLNEIVKAQPDIIVIPKASVESVTCLENRIEEIRKEASIEKEIKTMLLIETAMGIMDIVNICKASKLLLD